MSLEAVLQNAVSGLTVAQTALRTTSNNISNVNTPGYTRKVVDLESSVTGGVGSGVQIADIKRVVDQFLTQDLQGVTSTASQYQATNTLQDQLQALLGDPSSSTSLSGELNTMMNGLAGLSNNPTSSTNRITAIDDIQQFGDSLSGLAQQVQTLRGSADLQIQQSIQSVNNDLQSIYSLNAAIQQLSIGGQSTGELEDQRQQAISDLAKHIDIQTFSLSGGGVGVSTVSGLTLLDDTPRQLVYTSPGTVASGTTFPQITVNHVNTITGAVDPSGIPLDGQIRSGDLRGLLDMRDTFLPNFADQLGQLGASVADQLNAVHNGNSTVPPPAGMTGRNTGLTGGDLQGFTGKTTFYAFDANNNVVGSATVNFSALPAGTTLANVITQVNTALAGSGSLSLVNGVLSFNAGAGATGVAIQDGAPPSSRGGRGFSQFFGMNDLVQAQAYSNFDTGLTATSVHNFAGKVALKLVGPNNDVPSQFTLDFSQPPLNGAGSTVTDVINALNAPTALGNFTTFSLDPNGALVMTPKPGYAGSRIEVATDTTNRAGTGVTFSNFFGVGSQYLSNAALSFSVKSNIAADPSQLALAQVDPAGTPALTVGDARGALALQALAQKTVTIPSAGTLAGISNTLSTYVALVVSGAGRAAAQAQTLSNDQNALQTELQNRVDSVSGVNLDEELANMVIFQNAYNASARIITTAQQLFTVLMNM
ncbi:MAG TPA: flagellar hook-associated protein FlgK [Candidatus Cybelea sp.]|nr:flagellar hook-associated protein FlgK [Candidatus Cybelea sp.]